MPLDPLDPLFRVSMHKHYQKLSYCDRWGHWHWKKEKKPRVITDGPGPMVRININQTLLDRLKTELRVSQLKSTITMLLNEWVEEKCREQGRLRCR